MWRSASVCLVLLLVLSGSAATAETMYARFTAPVRSGRTLGAATIGKLTQGEAVQVVGKAGRYYQVVYRGRTGWVYFNKLSSEKPEDVAALLGGGLSASGFQLENPETGGALRGLAPMAEDYLRGGKVPAWAAVELEKMQQRRITAEELEAFQREGGLGEYAREGTE